jgi:hypothetical protein
MLLSKYIRRGLSIIDRQREIVADLRAKGSDASGAGIMLDVLITSVNTLEAHRRCLAKKLSEQEAWR